MGHLADFNTGKRFRATVNSTKRLTPNDTEEIREIVLEGQQEGFECEVDEGFGVLVEASGEFGNSLHHRIYSVADLPDTRNGNLLVTMLVKRCSYVDEFNGELYQGVASNYLCDRRVGEEIGR